MKVFIVEDEAVTAMLLERMLCSQGCEVVGNVSTGETAVKRIETLAPSLLFMDIELAGEMDGIEAAAQIMKNHDIQVVFITGYDDAEHKRRALELGPRGFLVKPVNIDALQRVLAEIEKN